MTDLAAEIEAKRAARAAKKAAAVPSTPAQGSSKGPSFIKREFVQLASKAAGERWTGRRRLRIMTWNMLAQCLVRRDLFPGSDRLKWKDRKDLTDQIVHYDPDVACLQEVDRLEDHGPILDRAGYDVHHVIGGYEDEGKQHGLAIIWKRSLLRKVADRVVRFDEETVDGRAGLSRATRNVGLLCALEFVSSPPSTSDGFCVATCHLFWHGRYVYERSRQCGLLVRAARRFRSSTNPSIAHWPTFLAGDFNIQPSEAAYRLLTNGPLSPSQLAAMHESRVVHASVDKLNGVHRGGEAYRTMEGDEDRVFTNVRPAERADALLDDDDIKSLFDDEQGLTSLYGRWGRSMAGQEGNFFKDRQRLVGDEEELIRQGAYEPMWTNFTPLWRCTLDYIFAFPQESTSMEVGALLPSHRGELLEPGLPALGKEPSDHISLVADVVL